MLFGAHAYLGLGIVLSRSFDRRRCLVSSEDDSATATGSSSASRLKNSGRI
jgi:hypothetical protein